MKNAVSKIRKVSKRNGHAKHRRLHRMGTYHCTLYRRWLDS